MESSGMERKRIVVNFSNKCQFSLCNIQPLAKQILPIFQANPADIPSQPMPHRPIVLKKNQVVLSPFRLFLLLHPNEIGTSTPDICKISTLPRSFVCRILAVLKAAALAKPSILHRSTHSLTRYRYFRYIRVRAVVGSRPRTMMLRRTSHR